MTGTLWFMSILHMCMGCEEWEGIDGDIIFTILFVMHAYSKIDDVCWACMFYRSYQTFGIFVGFFLADTQKIV